MRRGWLRLTGLLGRLLTLGAVLYAFGGAALALGRVGLRALGGQRPYAREMTSKVSESIAGFWRALPFAAAGVALMILSALARAIVRRRRAARASPEAGAAGDGAGASKG